MKKQAVILAVTLLLSAGAIFAQTAKPAEGNLTEEAIQNYLVGVNSNNEGLRMSCAYFLGEYKADEAVIPLMRMLHNEKADEGRIMAALSLVKIGTGKAVYAVKQAAVFDDSERVRNLCAKFYNDYAVNKNGESSL